MRYRAFCGESGVSPANGNGNGDGYSGDDTDDNSVPWQSNEYAGLHPSVAFQVWNSRRVTQYEGSVEPAFTSGITGISSYLANVWKSSLEKARQLADKRFVYEGHPIYRRISPKLAIVEDKGFNPEEYGGNWEDYDFMKKWSAGRIIRPISIDEKILNPTGIGARPLQDELYDNVERREREVDKQRDDADKRIKDSIVANEEEKDEKSNVLTSLQSGASSFWGAVGDAFNRSDKTDFDLQMIAFVGIGAVLLLVLITK